MQKILDNACDAGRMETLKTSSQLTLGEIILKTEHIHAGLEEDDLERDPEVHFDFEYIRPTEFDSWRGVYKELALGFTMERDSSKGPVTISSFIKMCKECIGKSFYGYKGGDFVMSKHTPVWVANYGNSGNTGIVNVKFDYWLILETGHCEV